MKKEFNYKALVHTIKALPWQTLDQPALGSLMHMSRASAYEFGEALRLALQLYPDDENLAQMAGEELKTDNLRYDDYALKGDHAEFLDHFIVKHAVPCDPKVQVAIMQYRGFCKTQTDTVRAMTIFSREEELSGIFASILTSPGWNTEALKAFRYYLETHIALDSTPDSGHHALTEHYTIDDNVEGFYQARLEMYRPLFSC